MAQRLTIIFRNLAFYTAAGVMSVGFGPLLAMALLRIVTWDYLARTYLAGIGFLLKRLCGITVEVTGRENIPEGQVLFASAQQCTWEGLFFSDILDNPVAFMKNEMIRYPIVASVCAERGHIAANRGKGINAIRQTFDEARAKKTTGRSFFIFPTGWRTGWQLSPPLQHGVARIYQVLDLPCVPVAHNAVLCWPHESWLRLPGVIRVHILPPIEPGLDKAAFLTRLHAELFGATDDLLAPPPAPELCSRAGQDGLLLAQAIMDGRH